MSIAERTISIVAMSVMALYLLSMAVSLSLWVIRDAKDRGSNIPYLWAFASILTPIGLPYYLYKRYRQAGLGERETVTKFDRLLATWASASVGAFLVSAFLGPPDPYSQIQILFGVFVVFLVSAYFLFYRGKYGKIQQLVKV